MGLRGDWERGALLYLIAQEDRRPRRYLSQLWCERQWAWWAGLPLRQTSVKREATFDGGLPSSSDKVCAGKDGGRVGRPTTKLRVLGGPRVAFAPGTKAQAECAVGQLGERGGGGQWAVPEKGMAGALQAHLLIAVAILSAHPASPRPAPPLAGLAQLAGQGGPGKRILVHTHSHPGSHSVGTTHGAHRYLCHFKARLQVHVYPASESPVARWPASASSRVGGYGRYPSTPFEASG